MLAKIFYFRDQVREKMGADVVAQKVALRLNLARRTARGSCEVWLAVAADSTVVRLHCRHLGVISVRVEGAVAEWRLVEPLRAASAAPRHDADALET